MRAAVSEPFRDEAKRPRLPVSGPPGRDWRFVLWPPIHSPAEENADRARRSTTLLHTEPPERPLEQLSGAPKGVGEGLLAAGVVEPVRQRDHVRVGCCPANRLLTDPLAQRLTQQDGKGRHSPVLAGEKVNAPTEDDPLGLAPGAFKSPLGHRLMHTAYR